MGIKIISKKMKNDLKTDNYKQGYGLGNYLKTDNCTQGSRLGSHLKTDNCKLTTILVAGGAGYIGSFTVKELLNNGFDVIVLDSLENGHGEAVDSRAKSEVADLSNKKEIEKVFKKYEIKAVIDFAAYLAVSESMEDPRKYMKNNVQNFIHLLDIMVENKCKYIIKSSTASTYGNPLSDDDFPLKESYQENYKPGKSALLEGIWDQKKVMGEEFFECLVNYYHKIFSDRPDLKLTKEELTKLRIPASVYGLTKLLDEIILEKYNQISHINYIALRYFNVCGAGMDGKIGEDKPNPTTLMTMVIYSILGKSQRLKVYGADYPTPDGTGIRDYIHPLDLATGHLSALKNLLKSDISGIFNLGNGKGYSVFELIAAIEKVSKKKVDYDVIPRRSGDPAISIADPSKAKKLLNWKAKYNLQDMAKSAWKWHTSYPNGYES